MTGPYRYAAVLLAAPVLAVLPGPLGERLRPNNRSQRDQKVALGAYVALEREPPPPSGR